jgi:hypothetical protein
MLAYIEAVRVAGLDQAIASYLLGGSGERVGVLLGAT